MKRLHDDADTDAEQRAPKRRAPSFDDLVFDLVRRVVFAADADVRITGHGEEDSGEPSQYASISGNLTLLRMHARGLAREALDDDDKDATVVDAEAEAKWCRFPRGRIYADEPADADDGSGSDDDDDTSAKEVVVELYDDNRNDECYCTVSFSAQWLESSSIIVDGEFYYGANL